MKKPILILLGVGVILYLLSKKDNNQNNNTDTNDTKTLYPDVPTKKTLNDVINNYNPLKPGNIDSNNPYINNNNPDIQHER